MGLLLDISKDLHVSIAMAGLLISGYALGAWLGGVVIDHGPGLKSVFWISALLPLVAIGIVLLNQMMSRAGQVTHS